MYCPNCGKPIPTDARFCPACGAGRADAPARQEAPADTSVYAQEAPAGAQSAHPPAGRPPKREHGALTAVRVLLALAFMLAGIALLLLGLIAAVFAIGTLRVVYLVWFASGVLAIVGSGMLLSGRADLGRWSTVRGGVIVLIVAIALFIGCAAYLAGRLPFALPRPRL
nr:zinc ribbon domain-containing protein [Maliibacterium massiliense]